MIIDPIFRMSKPNKYDQVSSALEHSGWKSFERPMPEFFNKASQLATGAIIDVGANTGFYSLLSASVSESKIYAFEPDPEIIPILLENISINDFSSKIDVSTIALSSKHGTSMLYIPDQSHGCVETSSSLNKEFKESHSDCKPVAVETIDRIFSPILRKKEKISLIKIDVEGHEAEVLRGAEKTIRRCRPVIFIEILPAADIDYLNEFIRRFKYKDIVMNDQGATIQDIVKFRKDGWNHIFCPEENVNNFLQEA